MTKETPVDMVGKIRTGKGHLIANISGMRFKKLVALNPTDRRENGAVVWVFKCDCGKTREVAAARVVRGQFGSCGCGWRGPRKGRNNTEALIAENFTSYKYGAACRSHEFALTLEQFSAIVSQPCHYCGGTETRTRKLYSASLVGVDRMDSSIGYVTSNCVPCCRLCNRAKGTRGYKDFMNWITRLVAFRATAGSS